MRSILRGPAGLPLAGSALAGSALAGLVLAGGPALGLSMSTSLATSSAPPPGPVVSTFDLGGADGARGVAVLPDGGLVVAAAVDDHVVLLRLRSDDTPDPDVGSDGQVAWSVPGATSTTVAAMLVDTQGRVVIAGWRDVGRADRALVVARFTSSLVPDPTFGTDGSTVVSGAAESRAWDVKEQGDGRLVVLGQGGATPHLQVLRFSTTGDLDPSFGTDGIAQVTGSVAPEEHAGIALTSDAKTVVAGAARSGTSTVGLLARLTPTGAPDPTFSGDGRLPVAGQELTDVVRRSDGRLVAVGSTMRSGHPAVRLVRVSSTGVLDRWPGTSSAQRTIAGLDADSVGTLDLVLKGNDRLLVTGHADRDDYNGKIWLTMRTTADGELIVNPYRYYEYSWGFIGDGEDSRSYAGAFAAGGDIVLAGGFSGPGTDADEGGDTAILRYPGTPVAVAAATELRETYSTGSWKGCGTTSTTACARTVGAGIRFGGRSWPAASTGTTRLEVQRTTGAAVISIPVLPTGEGNLTGIFVPDGPGTYRVRLRVPASQTTRATTGAWRYVTVS